jgi:hypothetical protein
MQPAYFTQPMYRLENLDHVDGGGMFFRNSGTHSWDYIMSQTKKPNFDGIKQKVNINTHYI